ncbi:MAG TPA: MATE family efflux transporter [Tepidisphaeraceae bacterium]
MDNSSLDRPVTPLRELLTLAIPTVLQMFSYTIEQFTDIQMLSRVSDDAATAAGQAGLVGFCVLSFGFGVLMLVNALVSQAYGGGREADCGGHLWQGIWFAIVYGIAVLPIMLLAGPIFRAMGHSEGLIPLEVEYFNLSVAFILVKMLAIALGQFTLAVNRPNLVLIAATVGMVGNIFANWLLIYGNWGFPAMGVAGAAWGTNVAITIELVIVAGFVFRRSTAQQYRTLVARFDRVKFRELLRLGLPSGFQTVGDVAAWTIFFGVVIAIYGEKAMHANNYMIQYMKISFMPAFGLSVAVTALVGRYIGAGKPDVAEHRAHLGFKVAAIYMLLMAVLFVAFRRLLMGTFSSDAEVIRLGGIVAVFCAVFQLFDAVFIIYSAALRGASDTFWPMVVQITLCWTVLVGGGLATAYCLPQLGISGPWAVGAVFCVILSSYMFMRFKAGRWKRSVPAVSAGFDVVLP